MRYRALHMCNVDWPSKRNAPTSLEGGRWERWAIRLDGGLSIPPLSRNKRRRTKEARGLQLAPMPDRQYTGVFPVVPTTFDERGDLDLESQLRAVDFLIDAGSNG